MSEQPAENEPQGVVLGDDPAAQMSQILGLLAPEEGAGEAEPGAEEGAPPAAEPGQQPPAAEGAGGDGGSGEPPAGGDGGKPDVPGDGTGAPAGSGDTAPVPGDDGARAGAGALDATSLTEKWGEISTAFETAQTEHLQADALAAVREEYQEYFKRLEVHPRLLVGEEVQSLTGPGKERLRDAQDAREWQDAAKHLLWQEVQSRAAAKSEEMREVFTTVHQSIDLFRDNHDLIPGTKQFDRELADQFATLAKSYEVRSGDKLIGYAVPVQPMINQLRSQLAAQRAAKAPAGGQPAAPAAGAGAPSPAQQRAAEQPRDGQGRWDAPQAGVTSKAGSQAPEDNVAAGLMDAFFRQNGFSI